MTLDRICSECARQDIKSRYRTDTPLSDPENHYILVKSGTENEDIVYSAERDCVEDIKGSEDGKPTYLELKKNWKIVCGYLSKAFS